MRLQSTLLAVRDMTAAVAFYCDVLGMHVTADFGANVTLSGGLCLQTLDTWRRFLGGQKVAFGGRDGELYFEAEDFDTFAAGLTKKNIRYVHPVKEHQWGQRVVRFYDPDSHVIEAGESLAAVAGRFIASGMSVEETARRMDVPPAMVEEWIGITKICDL